MPDDDETADKYVLADEMFSAAGLGWYELSNWARDEAAQCRHNVLYWHSDNWLGIGPGAHSHVNGERWWNVKHPAAYAARLMAGESPRHDGETIDAVTARLERVMLETRLRTGLRLDVLVPERRAAVAEIVSRGLANQQDDRLVLTRSGRLLADAVVRELAE
jgi:oxygen-independent coproporphyrinogen-3 oxidase